MAMVSVRYRDWLLEVDPIGTASAYVEWASVTAECACGWCRNFAAWRAHGYPADLAECLSALGLDLAKESDVYQQSVDHHAGTVHYRWFFHCRGRVVSGPQAWNLVAEEPDPVLPVTRWELNVREVSPIHHVALGFGDDPYRIRQEGQFVPVPLRSGPTVQVELRASLPWTVSEALPRP
jgi:hypothetical protein